MRDNLDADRLRRYPSAFAASIQRDVVAISDVRNGETAPGGTW
jgi:hypothetical protein